jgi:hypothetical protein
MVYRSRGIFPQSLKARACLIARRRHRCPWCTADNLKNLTLELRERVDRRYRASPLGKSSLVVRHALRRGPAPLRRDRSRRTPRSSSTAWTKPRSKPSKAFPPHSPSPDQPGAHLALDGGDHDGAERSLKLLFARARKQYCRGCGGQCPATPPTRSTATLPPGRVTRAIPRLIVTFPVTVPKNFSERR